jgi:protease-4
MSENQHTILGVALRAFTKALFVIIGIFAGLFLLILFFSLFSGDSEEVTPQTKATVLFNPDGTKSSLKTDSPLILQINLNGVIGAGNYTIDKMRNLLDESQSKPIKEGRVKALFLHINSPGGGAFDSDAIYRLIMAYKLKHNIPVYAYTDQILASGGYYIAVAADKIYASPVGLIGSVGVLVPTMLNFSKLLERFDVETLTIAEGKNKDALNPLRPWTQEDKDYLKPMIDYFYDTFVSVVAERRPKLTKEVLVDTTGAKVFAPPKALEFGYIDEIVQSQNEALLELVKVAGLEGKHYQIVTLDQSNWLQDLFKEEFAPAQQSLHMFQKNQMRMQDDLTRYAPLWLMDPKIPQ